MDHSNHLTKPFPIPNPESEILILLLPSLSLTPDEVPFPSSNWYGFMSLPLNSLLTLLPLVLIHLTPTGLISNQGPYPYANMFNGYSLSLLTANLCILLCSLICDLSYLILTMTRILGRDLRVREI